MTGTSAASDWLPGFVFVAALFGLRKLDPGDFRVKTVRPDDWRLLWAYHAEIGSPALPLTASWCK